jgi:hypothetical protein
MNEPKSVPQMEFKTVADFIKGQNNFWHFFIEDSFLGQLHRSKIEAYTRFEEQNPEFARELMQKATRMDREQSQLPWEDLYRAYQLMSKLVYEEDRYVRRDDGRLDNYILCR